MHHLYSAGDVSHAYAAGGTLSPGGNLMASSVKPGGYWPHTIASAVQGRTGESIDLAARGSTSGLDEGALTPDLAYSLDVKIDDGAPASGDLYASDGASVASGDCVTADATPGYFATNAVASCVMHLWFEK